MLQEKDSDNRTALHGPQGHSLHCQALLWLKKLVVEADTVVNPATIIYPVYDEHSSLL